MKKIIKSDEEWQKQLTSEQYQIARGKGTEPAFCGVFYDNHQEGVYHCICCDLPLFASGAKFDSGTGWPSFFQPVAKENVEMVEDRSHGMVRTEITCARCDAHLGHVFHDGPKPTGLRFCLNSASLRFVADETKPDGDNDATETATFGAGCFWGMEVDFRKLPGVKDVTVGYMGGTKTNPTYEEVCTGKTGHAEVAQVKYDPSVISYNDLLQTFWKEHDPTTINRQGPDVGTQYRSAIFYHTAAQKEAAEKSKLAAASMFSRPIVTEITPAPEFYRAEEYHQRYVEKRNQRKPVFGIF